MSMLRSCCPRDSSEAARGWERMRLANEGRRRGQRCLVGQRAAEKKREHLAAETAAGWEENGH